MVDNVTKEGSRLDWRQRATISVQEYGKLMGVGRNTAYQSVRDGDIATIKVGGCIRICVPALLRMLEGVEE